MVYCYSLVVRNGYMPCIMQVMIELVMNGKQNGIEII